MSLPSKELSDSALDALIARERTRVVAPLTEWRALSAQLRDEGLIRTSAESRTETTFASSSPSYTAPPKARSGVVRWGARMLIGAALLGTGVVVGRSISVGQELVPIITAAIDDNGDSLNIKISNTGFTSTTQAKRVLARSQTEWRRAAAYLAEHDSAFALALSPEASHDRLVGLDRMVSGAQSALEAAPDDPVLNQYYLSAYGARQRAVQSLRQSAPEGAQLTGF
jgi:hypothetical protein